MRARIDLRVGLVDFKETGSDRSIFMSEMVQ